MALSRLTPFLLAALLPVLAQANSGAPLQEAERLLQQGRMQAALEYVDAHLAKQPGDADARFLKGMILASNAQTDAAIEIFKGLTEDHPELPEPYNNLAVLYAAQGRYEMARRSLEVAILTHPGYATAYENLGDLYARMAVQAYDKTLQLDAGKTAVQGKSNAIRTLIEPAGRKGTSAPPARTVPLQTPPLGALPAPERTAPPPQGDAPTHRATSPVAEPARPVTPAVPLVPAQAVAPPPTVQAPVETRPLPAALATDSAPMIEDATAAQQAITRALQTWATQQASQRGYSSQELGDIEISIDGNQARARALQRYQKDGFRGWIQRSFSLSRQNGLWQIERVR